MKQNVLFFSSIPIELRTIFFNSQYQILARKKAKASRTDLAQGVLGVSRVVALSMLVFSSGVRPPLVALLPDGQSAGFSSVQLEDLTYRGNKETVSRYYTALWPQHAQPCIRTRTPS